MKKGDTFAIQIDWIKKGPIIDITSGEFGSPEDYNYTRAICVHPTSAINDEHSEGAILIDLDGYDEPPFGVGSMIVIEFVEFDCDGDYIFRMKKPD